MALLQSLTAVISGQVARTAPIVLESLNRAIQRIVTLMALRIFFAMLLAIAFVALFSESMRQLDEVGRIQANARLLGSLGLCLLSGLLIMSFSLRPRSVKAGRSPARQSGARMGTAPQKVTTGTAPSPTNGLEVLRHELRMERDAFLTRWRGRTIQ